MKAIIAGITVCIAFVVLMVANEVGGTAEVVSEPYTATYTYCGAYTGVGGGRHCSLYLTGTERRVNTIVHGWFFDVDSYKVVD